MYVPWPNILIYSPKLDLKNWLVLINLSSKDKSPALENIKNIFILKPEYLFGNKYLFTEYLFEKKKPERKGGKRAKVYTVAICTVLFVAFFVTCAKKKVKVH